MQRKKQNFVQGAMILMIASLLVKAIGALFKIPLKNLIGGYGMGLFGYAYQIYNMMLIVSSVGLPVALSKIVAEANALGNRKEIRRAVQMGAALFVPVGALCSAALFFGAEQFAAAFGNIEAAAAMRAIAPSVVIVSVLAVLRGYYQGMHNMVPTAVSQVIEALGKLGIGLALSFYAMRAGWDLPYVAAAAILGVTIGEVLSCIYICITAAASVREGSGRLPQSGTARSRGTLFRTLLGLAIPVTVSNAIMSITALIDAAMMSNRLQQIGMSKTAATELYGIYNTMPQSFFNLPQTVITAVAISIVPAVAAAAAANNIASAERAIGTSLRLGMLIALPCGTGFLVLAGPILRLLFSSDTVVATPMLQVLGLAVPCVALVALTNAVLQGIGRANLSFVNMFLGAIVKIFAEYALIGNPQIRELGAPISTVLCYVIIMLLNLWQIQRLTHALPDPATTFAKPFAAAVGMGAATVITYRLLAGVLPDALATLGAIAVAVLVYAVLLLALRAIRREDVALLPKGEKIAELLRLK